MALFVFGVNYRSTPLCVRERLAFHVEELPRALAELSAEAQIAEAVILSTCNRTELYCQTEAPQSVLDWWASYRQVAAPEMMPYLYRCCGRDAVRHAFRVASGLDSMVLGEPQILGQMKDAVRVARTGGTLGMTLDRLLQEAFAVAKDVRSTTAIGNNIVSMAAAAVCLAEAACGRIDAQRVLFIGAGEMIELCATHFSAQRPRQIVVANRSIDRGRGLAERFSATAIRLEELGERLAEFDIVVSCTASQLPIIGLGMVERALRARAGKPMFIVDLAVPRDVEMEAGALDGVSLYTVDDLVRIVDSGKASRQSAVHDAESMIAGRMIDFLAWLQTRESVPLIRALRDSVERMRRHEVERAGKLLARGEAPARVLEQLSQRLSNKFLHAPSHALGQWEAAHSEVPTIISRLFHLHGDECER